jgi:hypothetical protein
VDFHALYLFTQGDGRSHIHGLTLVNVLYSIASVERGVVYVTS